MLHHVYIRSLFCIDLFNAVWSLEPCLCYSSRSELSYCISGGGSYRHCLYPDLHCCALLCTLQAPYWDMSNNFNWVYSFPYISTGHSSHLSIVVSQEWLKVKMNSARVGCKVDESFSYWISSMYVLLLARHHLPLSVTIKWHGCELDSLCIGWLWMQSLSFLWILEPLRKHRSANALWLVQINILMFRILCRLMCWFRHSNKFVTWSMTPLLSILLARPLDLWYVDGYVICLYRNLSFI